MKFQLLGKNIRNENSVKKFRDFFNTSLLF